MSRRIKCRASLHLCQMNGQKTRYPNHIAENATDIQQ